MKKPGIYTLLSLVFMTILVLPGIQTVTRLIPERHLFGVNDPVSTKPLNWDNWYDFSFQAGIQGYLDNHYGLRPFYIRTFNQIDHTLFREPHGSGVLMGKEGFLYEEWFIHSYYGHNYIGEEKVNTMVQRLSKIRDYLNAEGKELLVVASPGKADYWPEYIPDRLRDTIRISNHQAITYNIWKQGIPLIDFNRWFVEIKDQVAAPLFPKTGTHWSHYGARLALDSLAAYMKSALNLPVPEVSLGAVETTRALQHPDYDLEKLMNLFLPMKRLPLAYPEVIIADSGTAELPKCVVISDSFFWDIFNLGLDGRLFSELKYWYYNSTVYPDAYLSDLNTKDLNLPEALKDVDLLILMACPATIQDLGWGFIDRAFIELVAGMTQEEWAREYEKMVQEYIRAINNTPDWKAHIEQKATDRGISVDSMMLIDARFMVDEYVRSGGI